MNVTYRTDNNLLYISLKGRIDASNSTLVEEQIFNIKKENEGKHTVIDADDLEYISSAGLRIILRLRKEDKNLAVINVAPDVYSVFDMTGFTDMVTVEKAYPKMSIVGCELIAKGANGAIYRYDDETILKIYYSKDALPEIQQERENARKAFVLGINTAIPYGIVRVGNGYGTVTELLDAVNVTKLICDDPVNIEKPVEYYVDLLKSIHSVEAEEGAFPDMKETALNWADFVADYIPKAQSDKLRAMIEALPQKNTLLHGDYHTSNIMIQNCDPLLIDLDTLCVGHPVFELGSMYNAFIGFSELDRNVVKEFLGYDFDTAKSFWHMALQKYLGTTDSELCEAVENKARVIGYTRLLRRSIRRPEDDVAQDKIAHYRKKLIEVIDKVDTLEF